MLERLSEPGRSAVRAQTPRLGQADDELHRWAGTPSCLLVPGNGHVRPRKVQGGSTFRCPGKCTAGMGTGPCVGAWGGPSVPRQAAAGRARPPYLLPEVTAFEPTLVLI